MFLTRFRINTARRAAWKLLSSAQAMHAAVLSGFAAPIDAGGADGARVLWRVDNGGDHRATLFIVSPEKPDLTHLVEQVGWPTTETWDVHSYGEFLDSLEAGQQWAFRLTANPVQNLRRKEDSPRTQRVGHVTVKQQQDWLLSRAEKAGIAIPVTPEGEPDLILHSRTTTKFRRGNHTVTLRVATYDGRLQITNADDLRRTLVGGLGHAKAYGCGLLTLAPPR